jgi:hypothetical protein
MVWIGDQKAAALQHPHDTPAEPVEQLGQFQVRGPAGTARNPAATIGEGSADQTSSNPA